MKDPYQRPTRRRCRHRHARMTGQLLRCADHPTAQRRGERAKGRWQSCCMCPTRHRSGRSEPQERLWPYHEAASACPDTVRCGGGFKVKPRRGLSIYDHARSWWGGDFIADRQQRRDGSPVTRINSQRSSVVGADLTADKTRQSASTSTQSCRARGYSRTRSSGCHRITNGRY